MVEHLGKINATALIGVGAAFDFHAGTKPRAPRLDAARGAGMAVPAADRTAPACSPLPDRQFAFRRSRAATGHRVENLRSGLMHQSCGGSGTVAT